MGSLSFWSLYNSRTFMVIIVIFSLKQRSSFSLQLLFLCSSRTYVYRTQRITKAVRNKADSVSDHKKYRRAFYSHFEFSSWNHQVPTVHTNMKQNTENNLCKRKTNTRTLFVCLIRSVRVRSNFTHRLWVT